MGRITHLPRHGENDLFPPLFFGVRVVGSLHVGRDFFTFQVPPSEPRIHDGFYCRAETAQRKLLQVSEARTPGKAAGKIQGYGYLLQFSHESKNAQKILQA